MGRGTARAVLLNIESVDAAAYVTGAADRKLGKQLLRGGAGATRFTRAATTPSMDRRFPRTRTATAYGDAGKDVLSRSAANGMLDGGAGTTSCSAKRQRYYDRGTGATPSLFNCGSGGRPTPTSYGLHFRQSTRSSWMPRR